MSQVANEELVVPLPNGATLRCGPGEQHRWGGHVRLCDAEGDEVLYWDQAEWQQDPEGVMGAIFGAAEAAKLSEYFFRKVVEVPPVVLTTAGSFAERARKAVRAYAAPIEELDGALVIEAMAWLVSDLMWLCRRDGLDWRQVVHDAGVIVAEGNDD